MNVSFGASWAELSARLANLPEYRLILEHYAGKVARRSNRSYIEHIDEGVHVYLSLFGWEERPISAFCVHPIFQGDESLGSALRGDVDISDLDRDVIVLAMEYRRVANAYTIRNKPRRPEQIELSPLDEVNRMLVADKVQNRRAFVKYIHDGRPAHVRSLEYFDSWLARLGIDEDANERVNRSLDLTPR